MNAVRFRAWFRRAANASVFSLPPATRIVAAGAPGPLPAIPESDHEHDTSAGQPPATRDGNVIEAKPAEEATSPYGFPLVSLVGRHRVLAASFRGRGG